MAARERALLQAQKRLKITRRESGHCVSPSISIARRADLFSRHSFECNHVSQVGCVRGTGEEKVVCAVPGGRASAAAADKSHVAAGPLHGFYTHVHCSLTIVGLLDS